MNEDVKEMTTEALETASKELAVRSDAIRARRKKLNDELTFRDNLSHRAEKLKGMTPEEITRVMEMAQRLVPASIESAERVNIEDEAPPSES